MSDTGRIVNESDADLFQARSGSLAIEDMDGGTFTISNGGVFGSLFGTPIINPPQSAILGMHRIDQRAVVINGKVCSVTIDWVCPLSEKKGTKKGY